MAGGVALRTLTPQVLAGLSLCPRHAQGEALTVNEAAEELGILPQSVRRAIAVGTLEAERHGRDWWITEAQLAAYRANHHRRVGRPKKAR